MNASRWADARCDTGRKGRLRPEASTHTKGSAMKKMIGWMCAGDEEGMATVEYALVTVAAAAFAAVLIAIVKSPEVRAALASLVGQALSGG